MTMTRHQASAGRHGSAESSGADSWRSNETVKAPGAFGGRLRGTSVKVNTEKQQEIDRDAEISPGSGPSKLPSANAVNRSAWEYNQAATDFGNYRRDLKVLDGSGGQIPSISRHPPTATSPHPPNWAAGGNTPAQMPTSIFGSFYNDSEDELGQLSPGFRPGSANDNGFPADDRRPSVASATTVSSSGSKSSVGRNFHKKLQGFFGEEPPSDSRQNSEASLPHQPQPSNAQQYANRIRANSTNNTIGSSFGGGSRPASPTSSRPRTPLPSSEVTPWEFQDYQLPQQDGPTSAANVPRSSIDQASVKSAKTHHTHKIHLPGHRHHKSKDEPKVSDLNLGPQLRPSVSREDSASSRFRRDDSAYPGSLSSALSSRTALAPRASSPTPSQHSIGGSTMTKGGEKSPRGSNGGKRGFRDMFRRKDKAEKAGIQPLTDLPSMSSISLQQTLKSGSISQEVPTPGIKKNARLPQEQPPTSTPHKESISSRGHGSRIPFKNKRQFSKVDEQAAHARDPNNARPDEVGNEALWNLDTDLSHMEGIVNTQQMPQTPPVGEIYTGWPPEENVEERLKDQDAGAWDAPDSWAVRRIRDENMGRLQELNEDGEVAKEEHAGPPYCVRIFRVDSTFAVLSVSLNTTVADICQILGKKTFLQDELDNYHIVMRKHDTSRQLDSSERPLMIQKKLLEQAGYSEADRLEDVGREDNSYLCRFTFLPAKMSGYSSLEKDPGFSKMQKFSHIDLQGRNLVTIPITLYQRATEIVSLNLSRNLSLDVPKDFVQACTNLREIKYTSNEAWRLPPSLGLASRLTMLDISNNRLENLDNAELHKLQGLQGLRLSNNKLMALPRYFGEWRALRSLNLSSNMLQEFPDFLCDVKTLVDLDISFNSIASLPEIGRLSALERLWATNNKLTGSFPDSVSNLINLREVDIRFNTLSNIDIMSKLPRLEYLMVGHNNISAFEGAFAVIKVLYMDHNPVTRFRMTGPVPSLSQLNLASAKLAELPLDLFENVSNLTKLVLDKNHFVQFSPQIGRLTKLEHLSIAKNELSVLPPDIGRLVELRYLDVRENNLGALPSEIWYARRLETLNVSSNVLDSFPKPSANPHFTIDGQGEGATSVQTPGVFDESKQLDSEGRRPSQASGYLSVASSPGNSQRSLRNGSTASTYAANGRKPSVTSRMPSEGTITPMLRKDSSLSSKIVTTFAGSLRHLFLADNRLTDDVFDELILLPELRILNVSYNEIYDIPSRTIRRWQHLTELYLSGNDLTSLPAEDFEEVSSLRTLHLNNNKFQVLPAELGKLSKLNILDVGSNALKYNVSNWPYDWNWNWNVNLKYLNLSGNKKLEIKPNGSFNSLAAREGKDLTDFTSLTNLRVLGLMDVTLMVQSIPEPSEDRRVRTSGSQVGTMSYGMADSLGRNEHLSTVDMVVPRFRSHDDESIIGMFDGQALSSGGSKIAKYLHENFKLRFSDELEKLRSQESPADALRRTYLSLNKELATAAMNALDNKMSMNSGNPPQSKGAIPDFSEDDLNSGSVATVMFIHGMELYVSNIGDAQAILIHSEGGHRMLTRKHDPAEPGERNRIREAGGFVSRQGKLNDVLEVSRAFGYVQMSPSVVAAPHVTQLTLKESDEMILLASREMWDYLTPDFAVDVARSERGDLMRAAQKLRDLAIAFGATSKITVMMVGVSDLRKRERARFRTHSMSMGPSGSPDELFPARRKVRGRDNVGDQRLARLDQEVEAPTGEVSLVFTDIKSSTLLWETYPIAMRSAIKMHNEVMRRQLRIIGGYEVKTEGDAFMVSFPTVTAALLWSFTVQSQLLEVQWPQEILNSVNGQEVVDADGNVIFRGLSVRMGIHWGSPVCEVDPVTKRMDYFGPMVNRASRISSVADGGQITVSSDFIAEIQRLLETHIESDRTGSTGSDETINDDVISHAIRRELRSLSSQGFEVKDLGERRLKGLENPEYIYLMYPHSLASRLLVQQQRADAEKAAGEAGAAGTKTQDSNLSIDTENVWDLWNVSLRLEMLCSALEGEGTGKLKPPETALLERMKNRGGEITDRFLVNFVEHQISRIETCTTTLALRNMVRPFKDGFFEQACPMPDVLAELASQLDELRALKESAQFEMAPS